MDKKKLELSNAEQEMILSFLVDLEESFGNAGCNNMCIADTPGNQAILTEMWWQAWKNEDGEFLVPDYLLLHHLIDKLKTSWGKQRKIEIPKPAPCEKCGEDVCGYKPIFCCTDIECSCGGRPLEPCLCCVCDQEINPIVPR